MIFLTQPELGRIVLRELRNAAEARIAVAYFSPDENVLSALQSIPQLTVVISEEFTINDPYKLERLSSAATQRSGSATAAMHE